MSDKMYCYPDSDVLVNKLGIRDSERLRLFERRLTMLRIAELIEHPIKGGFDLKHLQNIHKYIFQDLYEWAGNIRVINIAKGNMFCDAKYIEEQAEALFQQLESEAYLNGLGKKQISKRLAYYFSEINAIHPFREGNGRTQREFVRTLALNCGYILHFNKISRAEMLLASQKSFLCDYSDMERLFEKCLSF